MESFCFKYYETENIFRFRYPDRKLCHFETKSGLMVGIDWHLVKNAFFCCIRGTSNCSSRQELSFDLISKKQLVELRAGGKLTFFVLKKKIGSPFHEYTFFASTQVYLDCLSSSLELHRLNLSPALVHAIFLISHDCLVLAKLRNVILVEAQEDHLLHLERCHTRPRVSDEERQSRNVSSISSLLPQPSMSKYISPNRRIFAWASSWTLSTQTSATQSSDNIFLRLRSSNRFILSVGVFGTHKSLRSM